MTVGSARRMRPGLGWMLAFSAVFNLGENSLHTALNQMCKGGWKEREEWRREGVQGMGDRVDCVNMVNNTASEREHFYF